MNQPLANRTVSDLHALLTDPAGPAAPPAAHPSIARARAMGAEALRFWLAAADAAQLLALGVATRHLFTTVPSSFDIGTALGLGLVAALLAMGLRRALRPQHRAAADLGLVAGVRAAIAVAAALMATGAAGWLLLSPADGRLIELHRWITAWLIASGAVALALRIGATRLAGARAAGRRVVLVGAPDEVEPLSEALAGAEAEGWRLAGRFDDGDPAAPERLAALLRRGGADRVVLAIAGPAATQRIAQVSERISDHPVTVCLALDARELAHLPRGHLCIGRFALVDLARDPQAGIAGVAKRAMDLVLGSAALLAFAPVLLLAALAIRLESPGPVLFRQWRFGMGSRPILVLKFRTMRTDGCDATGARRTTAADPRVTRIGRILRRTSIDELPQLINVLRGEMSLVGPRPHPLHMRVEDAYYFEAVERYRARHMVKPGITGWAQINGSRGEIDTLEKARRRVALDLWYLDNWSLALDLKILLRTALGGFATFRAD